MLNDVNPPPLEPEYDRPNHGRAARSNTPAARNGLHLSDQHDRVHDLDRATRHTEGVDLIYPEPEDRGDSFNTTMSMVIVIVVAAAIVSVGLMMWWR